MTKNTSVSTEPHRWILANRGIPKSTMSPRRGGSDFFAQRRATASVAAEDIAYTGQLFREAREILARDKDFFYCVFQPLPTYLGEVIPVSGDGNLTAG